MGYRERTRTENFSSEQEKVKAEDLTGLSFLSLSWGDISREWEEMEEGKITSKQQTQAQFTCREKEYGIWGKRWEIDMAKDKCTVERLEFKIGEEDSYIILVISFIHSKISNESIVKISAQKHDPH